MRASRTAGVVAHWSTKNPVMVEYRMFELPKVINRTGQKVVDELNALAAEGWSVVAPLSEQYGITRTLLLQREKPAV